MSNRKNTLRSFQSLNASSPGGNSMTGNLASAITSIQFLDNLGIQYDFTGSPVGTFSVLISSNYSPGGALQDPYNAGTWIPLVLTYWNGAAFVTSTTIPTSVGSPVYLDLSLLSAPYIQATYTADSSTGSLIITVTGKEI